MGIGASLAFAFLVNGALAQTEVCTSMLPSDVSFCQDTIPTGYSALVPTDSSISSLDSTASGYYDAVDSILNRYNCESETYSSYTCNDCRDAYRRWVCAMQFEKCDGTGALVKPCRDLCEAVVRTCPVELTFSCPTDWDQDYSVDPSVCNNMDNAPPNSAGLARAGNGLFFVSIGLLYLLV